MVERFRLGPAIDADCHEFDSRSAGRAAYYVASSPHDAPPLVLLHSVNAAPSAFEMRPLFDHYRATRSVFAPDLPGFGRSQRSDRPYSPALYAGFIGDFLRDVVARPADVVAFSLSSEFAARAVLESRLPVRSMTLISPTGFSPRRAPSGPGTDRFLRALRLPLIGDGLYRLLTTRPSIRYFLGQSFVGDTPADMIDYAYATSHQPGAKHAPFHFLAMKLFSPDAFEALYARLELPVLAVHDRDPNISFERLDDIVARPNWQRVIVRPTLGLPHWERPAETFAALDRFWAQVASAV